MKKSVITIFLTLILLYAFYLNQARECICDEQTSIFVEPSIITAPPGTNFTISITIKNVINLYSWFFNLTWDPNVLSVIKVEEGQFLSGEGARKTFFQPKIYNDKGYAAVWCTMLGEPSTSAVSGSGVLAIVYFHVDSEGACPLHLSKTELRPPEVEPPISHSSTDGFFQYPIAEIFVYPKYINDATLVPGKEFEAAVNVSNVAMLYSWFFNLTWDPNVLSVIKVEEGPFLSGEGARKTNFTVTIDNEGGSLIANCTITSGESVISGSGTLAIIHFRVERIGNSKIGLDAMLYASDWKLLASFSRNGFFNNVLHEVTVLSVNADRSEVSVGDHVHIEVTVKNTGNVNETFYVTLWANDTLIGYWSVENLPPHESKTLSIEWVVSTPNPGLYTISAEAQYLELERNIQNNICMGPQLNVRSKMISTLIIAIIVIIILGAIAIFVVANRLYRKRSGQ